MCDSETIRDAERFQWLIKRGVAWRGCYNDCWLENEWLYGVQNARKEIDLAIESSDQSSG